MLRTTNKRIAPTVEKVLRSAIANAENKNNDVDVDQLFVTRSLRERRAAHEADPAGADGPRLPVSAAHCPHRRDGQREGIMNGSESTSVRISAGRHQDVALALVRQAGLCQAAAWRTGAEGGLRERLKSGRRQLDRSGSSGQQAADHDPHLASGHRDRPQRRRDREAEAGSGARRPSAKSSSTFRKCTSRSSMRSWCPSRLRCSWKSAWRSAARCAKRWIARCASAARESRFAFRAA